MKKVFGLDPRSKPGMTIKKNNMSSCHPKLDLGSRRKIKSYFFLMLSFFTLVNASESNFDTDDLSNDIQISVKSAKTKKVIVGFVVVGHQDHDLKKLTQRLQKDFEWSGQCSVNIAYVAKLVHQSDAKKLFTSDVSAAVFLSKEHDEIVWRLYDLEAMSMLAGKKIKQEKLTIDYIAHKIADEIWPQLFGCESCFRSKIAFCKQIWRKKYGREKPYKQIWVADFDGSNAQLFIDAPTVSFAPRWNNDVTCPLLLYSENTLSNVSLVLSNMFGKRKVLCHFDGLNMQPTFCKDGKKVIFCLSKDGSSQLYLSYIDERSKQRKYDRLTFNNGQNIAPCFIDSKMVAFVSDFETNKPQIYLLDIVTKSIKKITNGGYCACPNYSSVRNQIVYSKMIGSGMQLFTYDLKTELHTQITNSPGSKEEGSWSPCGNYIVFGYNKGNIARIAQLHVPTGTIKFLTSETDACSYPDCSPIYDECLGILSR